MQRIPIIKKKTLKVVFKCLRDYLTVQDRWCSLMLKDSKLLPLPTPRKTQFCWKAASATS